ncbi:HesA/MoeB/ThiF family protein [Candidatus Woesearchaeota archaeon]|nr:HesA/MoeB/ThiF family protein [Candidatus Woesearchaeota archaeon]
MSGRYSRQEVLDLIGPEGQKRLSESSVAIVGCGALGSVSAELLARAGIGRMTLVDHDVVDITNLQRQALYTESDLKMPKASCLAGRLKALNSAIEISAKDVNLNFENISALLSGHDLVLDCTDNLDTRFLLNEFCVRNRIQWVHSASVQEKGVVIPFTPGGPCFRCVFPKATAEGSCEELGILNTASHGTAAAQVTEVLKLLLGRVPTEGMLRFDFLNHTAETISIRKNPDCPVCRGEFSLLEGRVPDLTVKECKTKKGWTVRPKRNVKLNLGEIKKRFRVVMDANVLLVLDHEGEIVVHGYGELLFKDLKDEKRIREIAEDIFMAGGAQ